MFLTHGFQFTHEAIRDWEARVAPLITERLHTKRRRRADVLWYADEGIVNLTLVAQKSLLQVGGIYHLQGVSSLGVGRQAPCKPRI